MEKPEKYIYWSVPVESVIEKLNASPNGLTMEEAKVRLKKYGENAIKAQKKTAPYLLFLSQFKNSIIVILIIATIISAASGEIIDSLIILAIVFGSAILSFLQEYSSSNAVEKLRSSVQVMTLAVRDGLQVEVAATSLVPGDLILLSSGSLIPADGLILECDDFFVNQSVLTGEALPVEKNTLISSEYAGITERKNCVYMGTNVYSGSGTVLVVHTGAATQYGEIARHLTLRPPETEFEKGVRRFGYLLTEVMLVLTLAVFAINVLLERPAIEALLFSVALAVGLTPQLLPAIMNITLAKGSKIMAREGVIVRQLTAIENFGSMDVLCTDKTGTLTEGIVGLDRSVDAEGNISDQVLRLAFLNSSIQKGLVNPLDKAIIESAPEVTETVEKLGEISYDFTRKRLSVIIKEKSEALIITKGSFEGILGISNRVNWEDQDIPLDEEKKTELYSRFLEWSNQGFRVLGVAEKMIPIQKDYFIEDEQGMTFRGFLLFFDPPKSDIKETILELEKLGVQLRIITGDNKLIAIHTANTVGLTAANVLTGGDLSRMSDETLWNKIEDTTIFAEVDPNQKERIILALKKKNHIVGYMGDGINDAPALHAADVGISVNTAVDVAKESADFVLLEKSLIVLKRGIELGRATFANTMKYICITISANFGNMFSMAGASMFLPFLPLLPKQILLINFITDFPAITIAKDTVDAEMLQVPRRWDIGYIRNFMMTFGLISSAFDYIAFAVLLIGFKADQGLFQSGWFTISILTELLILLVMRTQRPFYKSKPAPILLFAVIIVGIFSLSLPFLPFGIVFGITPIPVPTFLLLILIAICYIFTTEVAKHFFYAAIGRKERRKG